MLLSHRLRTTLNPEAVCQDAIEAGLVSPKVASQSENSVCKALKIHGREQFARLLRITLIAPESRQAHRRAQFPGFCLLLTRHRKRALEVCFRCVALG